jgi:hypothetical protein
MNDLKLIDKLLCSLYWTNPDRPSLDEFKNSNNCIFEAMERLKQAYNDGEISEITLRFAIFFEKENLTTP